MESVRPPEPRRQDTPPLVVATARPRQGRVRQALRCPYCHDQVSRGVWGPAGSSGGHVVACARRGCGALYHRECWQECARFDGCAALACGSRDAREVSALGYALRVVRLLVAALLFPRRVALALRETQAGPGVWRRAWAVAVQVAPSGDERKNGPGKFLLHVGWAVGVVVAMGFVAQHVHDGTRLALLLGLGLIALLFLGSFVGPALVALAFAAGFFALRALARAFAGELAALARGDAPVVRAPRADPKKDA